MKNQWKKFGIMMGSIILLYALSLITARVFSDKDGSWQFSSIAWAGPEPLFPNQTTEDEPEVGTAWDEFFEGDAPIPTTLDSTGADLESTGPEALFNSCP